MSDTLLAKSIADALISTCQSYRATLRAIANFEQHLLANGDHRGIAREIILKLQEHLKTQEAPPDWRAE